MKTVKGIWLYPLQLIILMLITQAASAQLKAGFSASSLTGCPIMVVSFKDISTGNPTSWKWDLGNGSISYEQNPVTTYFSPGSYHIKLLVTNGSEKDSVLKSDYIVVNALPVPYFSASDTSGCFPLKVQFKDSSIASSGTITSWLWDFGDGTLSTEQNPLHTYTNPGTFTVILTVKNSQGCSATKTQPAYIRIKDGTKADFNFKIVQGCSTPVPVSFTNQTVGTGTLTYKWDFGDTHNSTQANPTNNYAPGIYSVKLIASNNLGCTDSIVKTNAIVINSIHADFSGPDSVCVGGNLHLINTSTSANSTSSSFYWDLGDGSSSTSADVDKIYTTPGIYKVNLVTDFGACKDSKVKMITVIATPTAAFAVTNNTGCSRPLDVAFQNNSTNAAFYQWSFGDGTTSSLQNPVHPYTSFGEFSVSLTAKNILGCATTLVKDKLVKVAPLKILSIAKLGVKDCLPVSVSPVAVIEGDHPIASYEWDFGDGTKSTNATPSHSYTAAGIYDVKLIVTSPEGCTDTLLYKEAVKAGNRPTTLFSADPRDVCPNIPVAFQDLSTGQKVDEWFWFFGDGTTSGVQNPTHVYNDTGYFNVTLITLNFGCGDTLKLDKYIHIKPPIAKFDTSYLCSDPLKRIFIDKSIGATTWDWDFGDGATSTAQNPTHTYAAPGNYSVVLTVTNGECQHTSRKNVLVIKERGSLSVSQETSCLNTRIIFDIKNVNQGNISTYSWYFDGIPGNATVTANNPIAWSFETPGDRPVTVVIADLLQCKDTIYNVVPVRSYGPKASFDSKLSSTCFGTTINFSDNTKTDGTHPITEYLWSYGEGAAQSYTGGPFSHDYSAPGNYDVKLVVTDSYGCKDSITKARFVSITNPVAKFKPSDTALCPSIPVTFANLSTGVKVTYTWDFGDGTKSNAISPVHSYGTSGTYKVTMVMVDVNGCTASDSATIQVYTAKADFTLSDSYSTCPPLVVKITNQSTNYTSINWDFGDGGNSQLTDPSHVYTYPGTYTVNLLVKNTGGCTDVLTKKVVIDGPTGTFDYVPKEACLPGKLNYAITAQNTVEYIWNFDDGNTVYSTVPTTSHTYIHPGTYLPKIILQDKFGCQVGVKGLDTVRIHSITPAFVSDTKLLCDSGFVLFGDASTSDEIITGYLWDFGDGTKSTVKNPKHSFSDTGFYSVKLISTTKFGCIDSTISPNYIKVVNSPSIKMPGDTSACEPAKILLAAEFLRVDTAAIAWEWNFGNGVTSYQQNPDSVSYSSRGSYSVSVKATNSDGCADIVTRTVNIRPKPAVDAGPDAAICRFDTYSLAATGADTYTWKSHPSLSCTNCVSPVAKPDSLVTYYVTGTTLFGCTNEDSVTIKVNQPFKMAIGKGDTLCKGETCPLKASGADIYQWSPSLWLDNSTSSTPTAKPDTSITYQVIGRDKVGCFKDTQSVRIKVYPIPSIEITNGDNIVAQVGGSVKLTTKSSADVTKWKWFPSQWLSCASCSEPLAAPKDKITYSVTATNDGECAASDQVTINLICNNANVFVPNTFSPNGDGANDVFYPRGTGLFNILTFRIFNRWGQVVFEKNGVSANDPQYGWNGTLNGQPLQPDVYVYLLEVVCSNNVVFPFKGNVSLIR